MTDEGLRQRIEAAVESSVVNPRIEPWPERYVNADQLLAALAEIFGERPKSVAFCARCGAAFIDGACPATHLARVRKEDCEPLLVPEDRLDDFAEVGWFPEEAP